ncbi:MFS transporter [Baekduia sp.]|uniref:MFS transporter n=1 Tax=Baekduia sp. TaxID=2600305 RepID=UPI0039C8BB9D
MSFALGQSLIVPVLPTVREHLHTSQNTATWVLTAYLLSASIFTPLLGRLGDMLGKRRMLIVALGALAVGSVIAALTTSIAVMLVARAIQGVGGGILPLAFGIARDELPPRRVAGSIGLLSGLTGAGTGVGLVLAGPIVSGLGYTWLFWCGLIVAGTTAIAARLVLDASAPTTTGRIGWRAPVLLSAALVALLLPISQAPDWGWLSARTLGLIVLAIAFAVAWIAVEARSEHPLIDMRMMRMTAVWTSNLIALLFGAGLYATFAFVPQFVQTGPPAVYGFGASVTESGLVLLPFTVATFAMGVTAGAFERRLGAKGVLVLGSVVSVVAFALVAVAHGEEWEVIAAMTILGFGFGMLLAALPTAIVNAVPAHQTGVATGMNANIRTIGGAIGTAAMSTIVTASAPSGGGLPTGGGYSTGFAMLAGAMALATLAGVLIPVGRGATEPPALADLAFAPATESST